MARNRSYLVPTTVTNKNGVQTTVYRKPTVSSGTTMLPHATLPLFGKNRERLARETATLLINEVHGPPPSPNDPANVEEFNRKGKHQVILEALSGYSENTLHRITETATTDLGWRLHDLLETRRPSEDYLNDWITIRSHVHDNTVNDDLTINGLETYPKLTPQINGHYPEERAIAINAIVRLTVHFGATGNGLLFDVNENQEMMVTIEGEGLRDLISMHEDPDGIADIITSRNLMDPPQIAEVYEAVRSTPSAISEGTL